MKKHDKTVTSRSVYLAAAAILFAGLAAQAETFYANGGGGSTKIGPSTCYLWTSANNWQVKDANDNLVTAASVPQQGDTVIFNKAIYYMSAYPDGAIHPGLHKVEFNVLNTIHQGYVSLQAGGEGLVMNSSGTMTWWAGIHIAGTGEVPIIVPAGGIFNNQKGVRTESKTTAVTLVKQGSGHFNTASEGGNIYDPMKTKLQGGTLTMRPSETSVGHEFIFDSNDPNLRLRFNYAVNQYRDWTIQDGSFTECAEVDNTTHGLTSDGANGHLYYLRLTGTPKLAEQRFTGQLYATAGIAFLPGAKQEGGADYVFTFAKAVSSAGGGISVTNGTVRLTEGASFTALKRVDIGPTGTFKVETGCGARFCCENLDVAAGGKLDVAAGVTLTFLAAKAGGADVPEGVYTSANASWITGDGQVIVDSVSPLVTIVLNVDSGTTYLPEALAAFNQETGENVTFESMNGGVDKLRTLVKRGAGQLNLTNAMSSYEGSIRVEGGILFSNAKGALGKTPNDLHPITVCTNAQYQCLARGGTYNTDRIFHIQGHGPNGTTGALFLRNETMLGLPGVGRAWGLDGMGGKMIYLDGDATIYTEYGTHWVKLPNITLGGHNLILRGSATDTPLLTPTIYGDGEIYVSNTCCRSYPIAFEQATADHTLHVGKGGEFRLINNSIGGSARNRWRITFAENASGLYGCFDLGNRDYAGNRFDIPVIVSNMIPLVCQSDRVVAHIRFDSVLSGPGGIQTAAKYYNNFYSSWLHLCNSENSFEGGLLFDLGIIWSYRNGAIPANGGPIRLVRSHATNKNRCVYDGVAFLTPHEVYDLPDLEVSGTYPARVQCGEGAWKKIVKEGANTLEYYSEVGAPLVEVKAGTLKLPRSAAAGLWEGIATYSSAADAQAAFSASSTPTNYIVRGPYMASMRERDNVALWAQNSLVTYTGYIWNRTGETRTWTLASSLKDQVAVFIDGSAVLTGAASTLAAANVTLTPGPHTFEWRAWNGSDTATGPYVPAGWANGFGFVYDAQGRNDTSSTNNFVLATDLGDGALFTRYTNSTERLPAFGKMAFSQGAALDLNGNAYVASEIMGWPIVTNTCVDATSAAALTITNSFTVDGANLAAGRQFVSSVPVTFAPGATVTLTNTASIVRNGQVSFPVLKAAALNWNGSKLKLDGKYWVVKPDPDGQTLSLEYTAGTYFILR